MEEPTSVKGHPFSLKMALSNLKKNSYTISKNRFLILGASMIYLTISGPAYINWSPFRECLYRAGAFSWLCYDSQSLNVLEQIPSEVALCDEQFLKVNQILSVATYCHFFCSFFAGILFDFIGPKLTGLLGCLFLSSGWFMVSISTQQIPLYLLGFTVMSMGLELSFLPLLGISSFFPKKEGFILSLMGSSRAISLFIPLLFKLVIDATPKNPSLTLKILLLAYSLLGVGICFFIVLLFIPLGKWTEFMEQSKLDDTQPNEFHLEFNDSFPLQSDIEPLRSSFLKLEEVSTVRSRAHPDFSPPCDDPLNLMASDSKVESSPKNNSENLATLPTSPLFSSISIKASEDLYKSSSKLSHFRKDLKEFSREVISIPFCLLAVHTMIFILRDVYFSESSERLIPDTLDGFAISAVVSFIPAPLFGYLADKIGIVWVMQILNYSSLQIFAATSIPSIPAPIFMQYISVITYTFVISFVLSQVYCFGIKYFPNKHMGKLIGIITSLGGLASLLSHPLLKLSVSIENFLPVNLIIIALSVIDFGFLLVIHFKLKKSGKMSS